MASSNLDFMRSAAVMCVFGSHLWDALMGHNLTTWHLGQLGVLIFFVHTSLVLTMSLDRSRAAGVRFFTSFYVRRMFRIYPLAMVCVWLSMLASAAGWSASTWTLRDFMSNLTLTQNLTYAPNMVGGLWTLPLEVQMYVVIPLLYLVGKRYGWRAIAALWVLSIPLALVQLSTTARLNVLGYAPCFIAGVLAWTLMRHTAPRLPGWAWPLAFVSLWPVFFVANHGNDMWFRWAFCLCLGVAIPAFQQMRESWLSQQIAKYSYGIYLSHLAIFAVCFSLPAPLAIQGLLVAVLAVGVPVAMFHLIEQPMMRAGHLLSERLPVRSSEHNRSSSQVLQPELRTLHSGVYRQGA